MSSVRGCKWSVSAVLLLAVACSSGDDGGGTGSELGAVGPVPPGVPTMGAGAPAPGTDVPGGGAPGTNPGAGSGGVPGDGSTGDTPGNTPGAGANGAAGSTGGTDVGGNPGEDDAGTDGTDAGTGGSNTPVGPTPPVTGAQGFDTDVPIGWAVVPGYGLISTTGGAGGEVVTVSSHGDLDSALGDDTPRIVRVQGTLSGSDIDVGSNKTILGVGMDARLSGFYLNMNPAQNVIIRNISISGGTDAIAARYTTQLWIDHVDVSDCGDGLIDITRESDHYTISWVHFSNHHKTMLLNGGSTHLDDRGKLNGTVHHNHFDATESRNPRAGFGKIHIYNNYNRDNGYGIGFHTESLVVAERNYFQDMDDAIVQMYDNPAEQGDALSIDNVFDNASGDEATGVGFTVTDHYLYDFALDEAAAVPEIVSAGAGPRAGLGEIGLMPIPGQGAVDVDDATLTWMTGTASPESYVVYFGTDTDPPQVSAGSETSYAAGPLTPGTQYFWRVDQVVGGATVPGKLWTFRSR